MSTDYTIVEPGFKFIPPPEPGRELEFLELCTRTCYKSEDKICPGSAEKLLDKVVNKYEHLSVTEHLNVIMEIGEIYSHSPENTLVELLRLQPMFKYSFLERSRPLSHPPIILRISGNIRMWREFGQRLGNPIDGLVVKNMAAALHQHIPFLFPERWRNYIPAGPSVQIIDANPLINKHCLPPHEMLKHMTLTCRIIGDRSMSHQLVRHRIGAYSQESQRYCNYGKKGFQVICPPRIYDKEDNGHAYRVWGSEINNAYRVYLRLLEMGVPPEDARSVLPNATKTEVVTTYTLGMWKHVFKHRANNPKAQWQIRGIMQGIQKHFQEILPEVFTPEDNSRPTAKE